MAYQPFGGGKHKCSGNAFAMFQIKAIFSMLLRRYEFALVDPPECYQDDYTQMIVQPRSPCRIRYRLRNGAAAVPSSASTTVPILSGCLLHHNADRSFRIIVDRQLCQGHAMCMGEAPELFRVDAGGELRLLMDNPPLALLDKATQAARYCPNQALRIEPVE